jgi:murein L,D-transpeptidase YcbB/YkuD
MQFTLDMQYRSSAILCFTLLVLVSFIACNDEKKLKEKELVDDPKSLNTYVEENIKTALSFASDNDGKIDDSVKLFFLKVVDEYYTSNDYHLLWSDTGKWLPRADALIRYLDTSAFDGLFREDYQFTKMKHLKNVLETDSVKNKDAVMWTKAELLFTDAFMHIIQDLKQGRLQPDSISWKNDPSKYDSFFAATLNKLKNADTLNGIFRSLQVSLNGYLDLRSGIKNFIDSMDTKKYTYLVYPYKAGDEKDSLAFIKKLLLRLSESSIIEYRPPAALDSAQLADAIKKYQKQKKLTTDGKITSGLIRSLNLTDRERFNRIAVTLDRYKQLPAKMPEKYIWVNLPGYYLQLWDTDTLTLTSKIICGKPSTPTPSITSAISDLVIFPTWTVPESIIKKEMLPGLKKNPGYLARKGLNLYNFKGERVDPSTVNWAKYSKGIPYKIQQGSGDDNALGVIKFNFENPYFVYLHDTNQRYLFKNGIRCLSHGCVRVQEWEKLAFYIVRNDSLLAKQGDTLRYNTDSITNWIANKEKHRIGVKNKIPLFIRYFSCEGMNGAIKFYDDMYGEDRRLIEKYFAGK